MRASSRDSETEIAELRRLFSAWLARSARVEARRRGRCRRGEELARVEDVAALVESGVRSGGLRGLSSMALMRSRAWAV